MPWNGLSAQRLANMLRNRVKASAAVTAGDFITAGLEQGTEFSFLVNGHNGAEFLVTVTETRPAGARDLSAKAAQAGQVIDWVAKREAKFREQQERGLAKREALRLRRLDRRQKDWLGPGS